MLTGRQARSFAERGYLVLPDLVSATRLERVDAEVDRLVVEAPPPEGHVGHHFYWPQSDKSPCLFDLSTIRVGSSRSPANWPARAR